MKIIDEDMRIAFAAAYPGPAAVLDLAAMKGCMSKERSSVPKKYWRVWQNAWLACLESQGKLSRSATEPQKHFSEVKERAYAIDPECWISYSGKESTFKRAMDKRRCKALEQAREELHHGSNVC